MKGVITKRIIALVLSLALLCAAASSQSPGKPPKPVRGDEPDDVIRITTNLVQTDVVVTDKNEKTMPDLKIEDFELYDNGKKQRIKFLEFVSAENETRSEGQRPAAGLPLDADIPLNLTAKDLKRVVAFVVDDLTIPYEDMPAVRQMLLYFVNNQMKDGDLVAIVRVIGGKGLLQQFTSDRQLLRQAIAALNVQTHPLAATNEPPPTQFTSVPGQLAAAPGDSGIATPPSDLSFEDQGMINFNDPNDESQRFYRGLFALTAANFVIDSLKGVPGRKNLFLISGGIPIFEASNNGSAYSNVSYLLHRLEDNAVRAGVVINTMDPRGLKASAGVVSFKETPARSALASADPNFGRGGTSAGRLDVPSSDLNTGNDDPFGPLLAGAAEHLGLDTVAKVTGGVAVVNTNNFKSGVEKALARGGGYYLLAYRPAEAFDNKFHTIAIKVKHEGARVYAHRGYVAREEQPANAPRTKDEAIVDAAKSPLAKRDLDVSANIVLKPIAAANKTEVGIHLLIEANRLTFTQSADGKYQASFDVVGFVYDQLGKMRGGFSETINTSLTPEDYQRVLQTGLTYSANTELPPGYFQIRTVVREESSGNLGTFSRYLELPDLTKGRLAMSSVFLFAANPGDPKATPIPLLGLRQLSHDQDLRYAALVYNARTSGNRNQLRARMIISQGGRILFQEPDQPIENLSSPLTRIGQVALAKVPSGRYVLTLIITDPLTDKSQTVSRSIDFTVVN